MTFQPSRINLLSTITILSYIEDNPEHVCAIEAQKALAEGWKILAVDQKRGACWYHLKTITIPVWAINKGSDYLNYYLSHELGHKLAGREAKHGDYFMKCFRYIAEQKNWHYEISYKPRAAVFAGIVAADFGPTNYLYYLTSSRRLKAIRSNGVHVQHNCVHQATKLAEMFSRVSQEVVVMNTDSKLDGTVDGKQDSMAPTYRNS